MGEGQKKSSFLQKARLLVISRCRLLLLQALGVGQLDQRLRHLDLIPFGLHAIQHLLGRDRALVEVALVAEERLEGGKCPRQ